MKSQTMNKQSGFSIIELMVAMVISVFMIGVAMTYFISSAQSYKTQIADGRIQENVRFALEILTNNLRMAGFCDDSSPIVCDGYGLTRIYTQNNCSATVATGAGVSACSLDINATTDRIAIDLASTTAAAVCSGAVAIPADTRVFATFWVSDLNADGTNSLNCEGFTVDTVDAAGNVTAVTSLGSIMLVNGIDAMQVRYGIDSDADEVVDSYQNAADVGTNTISTVKVVMLANSGLTIDKDVDLETDETRSYTLFDQVITFNQGAARSQELKQLFATTVDLKN